MYLSRLRLKASTNGLFLVKERERSKLGYFLSRKRFIIIFIIILFRERERN
jgi:hypothetical protein